MSFPTDYRGKLVLIDFWATWCTPCIREIPHLVQAHEKYGAKGLVIIGVTLDTGGSAAVTRFIENQNMTWEHVQKNGPQIAQSYGITSIPAAFLIDGDTGVILASGDELRGDALLKVIGKHLESTGRQCSVNADLMDCR